MVLRRQTIRRGSGHAATTQKQVRLQPFFVATTLGGCVALMTCLRGQTSSAFVSAPLPTDMRRREALGLIASGAALASGWPWESAEAKSARDDSICTIKCMEFCQDQLDPAKAENADYCVNTCANYCKDSNKEKTLEDRAKSGDMASRIIQNARRGKFNALRDLEKDIVVKNDGLGNVFSKFNNGTLTRNGLGESKKFKNGESAPANISTVPINDD